MHAAVRLGLRILRQELADRRPHLHVFVGELEPRRHHADHGEAAPVERDRPAQNAGIAPEIRDPEPVAQERERRAVVRGREAVADLGAQLEHVEQVRRNRGGLDFARIPRAREVVALRGGGRDSREVLRQPAQVVKVWK